MDSGPPEPETRLKRGAGSSLDSIAESPSILNISDENSRDFNMAVIQNPLDLHGKRYAIWRRVKQNERGGETSIVMVGELIGPTKIENIKVLIEPDNEYSLPATDKSERWGVEDPRGSREGNSVLVTVTGFNSINSVPLVYEFEDTGNCLTNQKFKGVMLPIGIQKAIEIAPERYKKRFQGQLEDKEKRARAIGYSGEFLVDHKDAQAIVNGHIRGNTRFFPDMHAIIFGSIDEMFDREITEEIIAKLPYFMIKKSEIEGIWYGGGQSNPFNGHYFESFHRGRNVTNGWDRMRGIERYVYESGHGLTKVDGERVIPVSWTEPFVKPNGKRDRLVEKRGGGRKNIVIKDIAFRVGQNFDTLCDNTSEKCYTCDDQDCHFWGYDGRKDKVSSCESYSLPGMLRKLNKPENRERAKIS